MTVQKIGSFKALLCPHEVAHFCTLESHENDPPEECRHRLLDDSDSNCVPWNDPNVRLNIPILAYGWRGPKVDLEEVYDISVYLDNSVMFKRDREEVYFRCTHQYPIDYEYLSNTKEHPLIVDPFAALLAVYSPNLEKDQTVERENFIDAANLKILEFMASGGSKDPRVKNFLGLAVMMDTASRTPKIMSPSLIENVIDWYAANSNGAKLWVGTGTEHLRPEQRIVGALKNHTLLTEDDYIAARKIQIDLVQGLQAKYILPEPANAIIFPAIEQSGLSEERNIQIANQLLEIGNDSIFHKLGSPFNEMTDWITSDVVSGIKNAQAVKTSAPFFDEQVEDYNAIRNAKSSMYTGDDRNFALLWLWGAIKQLEQVKETKRDRTYERNGFTFIRDANINALLGYIDLNPHQTIAAIIELSKWYHEKAKRDLCDEKLADTYLRNYLELMSPAMGMSTYVFFSRYNPTPSYTSYVELAHVADDVLDLKDGRVLPHRRSIHEGTDDQKLINGQSLAWRILSGATPVNPIENVPDAKSVIERFKSQGLLVD